MPAQRRHALARLSVPDLDGLVVASTCYVLPVWSPGDGADPAVFDEMSQHTKQLRQGKKIRFFFFNLTNLSARSTCTCSSPFPYPTNGPFGHCYLRLRPFRPQKRPRNSRSHCIITQTISTHFTCLTSTNTYAGTSGDRSHDHSRTGCTAFGTILISYSNTTHTQATTND